MVADEHRQAIEEFAAALAELRMESGKPSFGELEILFKKHVREASENPRQKPGGHRRTLPSTTAWEATRGTRLPSLATVSAFVEACRLAADEREILVEPFRFDATRWKRHWHAVATHRDLPPPSEPTNPLDDLDGESRASVEVTTADKAEEIALPGTRNSPTPDASVADRPSFIGSMTAMVDRYANAYAEYVVNGMRTHYRARFPSDSADSGNDP